MVTVTKYLIEADLRQKICDCEHEQKLKVLFKEVEETELRITPEKAVTGAYLLRNSKIIARCEHCNKIYFIMTTFEGGFKEQYVTIDSIQLFEGNMKELRGIINNTFDEYENEIVDVATEDHNIKVIEKNEDEEKTVTKYAYLNREDEELYRDLLED